MQVITGARLIDGTGAEPVANASIVIGDDGRIEAVGPRVTWPTDAIVIDVAGKTVMPGLIDSHVHFFLEQRPLQQRLLTPPSLAMFEAADRARSTLDGGVTSVRDAGGTPVGFKQAAARGLIVAPRMMISVGALSQTGGHGDAAYPSGVNLRVPDVERPSTICDGPDDVRRVVRTLLRAGADFIKLNASGGVLSPSDEPTSWQFTQEEIGVMVAEAGAQGKTCMAHAQATQGIKNAVRAGVESIEHGIYLDDEAVVEMKSRGTFLVPTLQAPLGVLRAEEERPGTVLPQSLRKTREVIDTHRASARFAFESGVRIAMGTDAGVGRHGTNAEELALLVGIGMSSMQAIIAATQTAAQCSHLDRDVGTLEPGKLADLLVVDGDPLRDIALLQDRARLLLIMQAGRRHKDLVTQV